MRQTQTNTDKHRQTMTQTQTSHETDTDRHRKVMRKTQTGDETDTDLKQDSEVTHGLRSLSISWLESVESCRTYMSHLYERRHVSSLRSRVALIERSLVALI